MLDWTYKQIRRFVIAVIGMTLLLIGIALLALPGPGVLFIAASLAVLAIEFVWARRLLRRLKDALPGRQAVAEEDEEDGEGRSSGRTRGLRRWLPGRADPGRAGTAGSDRPGGR